MTNELSLNEYFFICDRSGHFLKTKNFKEFDKVRNWDNSLFAGKVKNNQYLHYKIGRTWHKKKFTQLKSSDPIEIGILDFHILQHEFSSSITKIKIGGKKIPQTHELL